MKEELWLKKMKERLDDYSEPLPSDGWERLEKALQPSPVRMKRTIFFRRWTVAAAVALLLVVSSVGVWLLQSPVADEIRNTSMPAFLKKIRHNSQINLIIFYKTNAEFC